LVVITLVQVHQRAEEAVVSLADRYRAVAGPVFRLDLRGGAAEVEGPLLGLHQRFGGGFARRVGGLLVLGAFALGGALGPGHRLGLFYARTGGRLRRVQRLLQPGGHRFGRGWHGVGQGNLRIDALLRHGQFQHRAVVQPDARHTEDQAHHRAPQPEPSMRLA